MYDTKTEKNVCTFCKKELVDGEILKYRMEYPHGGVDSYELCKDCGIKVISLIHKFGYSKRVDAEKEGRGDRYEGLIIITP